MSCTHILLLELLGGLILPFDALATTHGSWLHLCFTMFWAHIWGDCGSPLSTMACVEGWGFWLVWSQRGFMFTSGHHRSYQPGTRVGGYVFNFLAWDLQEIQNWAPNPHKGGSVVKNFLRDIPTLSTYCDYTEPTLPVSLCWWAGYFLTEGTLLSGSQLYMEVSVPNPSPPPHSRTKDLVSSHLITQTEMSLGPPYYSSFQVPQEFPLLSREINYALKRVFIFIQHFWMLYSRNIFRWSSLTWSFHSNLEPNNLKLVMSRLSWAGITFDSLILSPIS